MNAGLINQDATLSHLIHKGHGLPYFKKSAAPYIVKKQSTEIQPGPFPICGASYTIKFVLKLECRSSPQNWLSLGLIPGGSCVSIHIEVDQERVFAHERVLHVLHNQCLGFSSCLLGALQNYFIMNLQTIGRSVRLVSKQLLSLCQNFYQSVRRHHTGCLFCKTSKMWQSFVLHEESTKFIDDACPQAFDFACC